ncbi:hypothetical protein GCM10011509_02870 [Ornithinimicrobium pekingense]|uniref:DUF3558 domain-containing protein n=2 Tax=Ornithinimicrobium pekingense TaxID=384677 RepID=A0ABQ2F3X8_9MICO|nr:hypothetical protein GCM10011509_02870 [Ornithinimicrobium pekingense]
MPSRRRSRVSRLAALTLAGALALAGCSGDEDGGTPDGSPTGGDTAVGTGGADGAPQTGGEPVAAPTAPADIPAALGERSASGGGTSVTVDADQAGFVLPSGNIACSVTAGGAVCQIADKNFTPLADHLSEANLAGCTAEEADVMRLAAGRGAWTCVAEPLTGAARVGTGGWWAEQVGGETLDLDGATLAVLPYGSTLTVGPTSCTSAESGVSCTSSELGRSFSLARTTYNYG